MRHNCIRLKHPINAGGLIIDNAIGVLRYMLWTLSKTPFLFSRCDRTFKSEYSWKRHQSNDEVHEKMENYKPFLTCEVSNHITPSKKLPKEFFTTHAHLLGTLPILTLVSSHLSSGLWKAVWEEETMVPWPAHAQPWDWEEVQVWHLWEILQELFLPENS